MALNYGASLLVIVNGLRALRLHETGVTTPDKSRPGESQRSVR